MLTVFNRKEVYTTNSMKRHSEIRRALHQAQIEFCVKVRNTTTPFTTLGRSTVGLNNNYIYTYLFYVHKKDYEKAVHIIGQA
ncbi:MAG: hypothetical protein PHG02_06040 [Oscillospiraceae bacterium]|nr:hypothetical protein [Oscillospiraceae bacterium]